MTLPLRMHTSLSEQGDSSFCIHRLLSVQFRAGPSPCYFFTLIHKVGFFPSLYKTRNLNLKEAVSWPKAVPAGLGLNLGSVWLTHWLSLLEAPRICSDRGGFDMLGPLWWEAGGEQLVNEEWPAQLGMDPEAAQGIQPMLLLLVHIVGRVLPFSVHTCLYNNSH